MKTKKWKSAKKRPTCYKLCFICNKTDGWVKTGFYCDVKKAWFIENKLFVYPNGEINSERLLNTMSVKNVTHWRYFPNLEF